MDMDKNVMFPQNDIGITVDDGTEEVPIKNTRGQQIGVFYIRPTDVGILHRYEDFVKDFDSVIEPIQQADLNANGTAKDDNETAVEALKEAEKRLSEKLNVLFDGNFSEAFFGSMNPFSLVGGRFYVENAIDAVGAYIEKRFDHEFKLSQNRVDKYTHGYRTGKHRNGNKRRRGPQQ